MKAGQERPRGAEKVAEPLRVLIVEDRVEDAELMALRLAKAGMPLDWRRVATEAKYLAALEAPLDLILCDWSLPRFSGLRALELYGERGIETPFIIVSGSIGEEAAVDALHRGAFDYVLKDNLGRLPGAVRHALEERRLRENRRLAEQALRESEQFNRSLVAHLPQQIFVKDRESVYVSCNARYAADLGTTPDRMVGRDDFAFYPRELAEKYRRDDEAVMSSGAAQELEEPYLVGDDERWVSTVKVPYRDSEGQIVGVLGIFTDITDRKRDELAVASGAERLRGALSAIVAAMGAVIEHRDPYTAGHQKRVARLAVAIAGELGLDERRCEGLMLAGNVHDVGKVGIPAEILSKPGKLSAIERNLIGEHPLAGHDILAGIQFETPVATIVGQHHERLDGSGYPHGLRGESILLEARILAVADVVEAMASHRPYRPALGVPAALEEIRSRAGSGFDESVVAACERIFSAGYDLDS